MSPRNPPTDARWRKRSSSGSASRCERRGRRHPHRLSIVPSFVPKQLSETLEDAHLPLDQHHPVIVPDLMAEMAEKRAIRLPHRTTPALALRVVGFGDVDRDQAVVVACENGRGIRKPSFGSNKKSKLRPSGSSGRLVSGNRSFRRE